MGEGVGLDHAHRYLIHDRDSILARSLDDSISNLGLTVLKSPPHSPQANAICERLIGRIRRECLDWLIPLSVTHLRSLLKEVAIHYNAARPHMTLGPGVRDSPVGTVRCADNTSRHCLGAHTAMCTRSVLGCLHHEYCFAPALA